LSEYIGLVLSHGVAQHSCVGDDFQHTGILASPSSSQRDHSDTEGDWAEDETMGEGTDISQGTKGGRTAEEDGEEESVGGE